MHTRPVKSADNWIYYIYITDIILLIEQPDRDQLFMIVTMWLCTFVGAVVPLPVQVVPQGIESVNGSDVNMGCTSPLVNSGGVMVCNSSNCPSSYLLDSNSPAIDTRTSDWASQLVTVRKNDAIPGLITFDHVVLTFGFDTAVSLTSIQLDLFLCPEWNIGASDIAVYGDKNSSLVLPNVRGVHVLGRSSSNPSQSSCDSLSTVSIPLQDDAVRSLHIIIEMDYIESEWVHIGEVRFLGISGDPNHTHSMSIYSIHNLWH